MRTLKYFSQGKPCSRLRVRAIELALGKKLPDGYRTLISSTGGGVLSMRNCYVANISTPRGEDIEVIVDQILGNGKLNKRDDNDLARYGRFLAEEWEIPSEVLLFATSESGMHECFVLNYGLSQFPQQAVLYLDNDEPGQYSLVAETFDQFLYLLDPSPDYDEEFDYTAEEKSQLVVAAVRKGEIGELLAEAVAASPTEDVELLMRRALEALIIEVRIEMYCSEDSYRFQDILFYLTHPFEQFFEYESFLGGVHAPDQHTDAYTVTNFLMPGFVVPGHRQTVNYFQAAVRGWWNDRVGKGVLVEAPQGYRLKEDYIQTVFAEFRRNGS